ncbi:MAG TPA: M23 family metallopeptidase [Acidimicrobiales bacterium]
MLRPVLTLVVLAALVLTGCGGDEEQTTATTVVPEPAPAIDLRYADVAGDYAAATQVLLEQGREVVDRLLAGDIASVYEQSAPEVKAEVSLEEVERGFAEGRAASPIGARVEERVIPVGAGRGAYFADYAVDGGRVRFRIGFEPAGLIPLAEPVRPLPPDPRANRPAQATLRLPFDGLWWAGVAPLPEIGNHHAVASDQRHAFDFLIWRNGSTYRGQGLENSDYWAWSQAVKAPGPGTVVAVQDGLADNRPGVETDTAQPAGNHVIVDLGNDEYAVLAHFQKGSIRVARGDAVTPGQVLGLVGNSGNSSEPHIHLHVQDSPTFRPGGSTGIPVRFADYEADGTAHAQGTPTSGQFVTPL